MVQIHPMDAEKLGLQSDDTVIVSSPVGRMEGVAEINRNGCPGVVHVFHGNKSGDVNELIHKDYCDPISGFPGFKGYFCKVEKKG